MAKDKSIFTCTECGGTSARWMGKCPSCNAWNTLIEASAEPAGGKNRFGSVHASLAPTSEVLPLAQIEAADFERHPTGIDELDRVLGGGMVEGGVVLIGGDPGIGKSTLLLQAVDALQRSGMNQEVGETPGLYWCGLPVYLSKQSQNSHFHKCTLCCQTPY